jgi:hypothetical protein
VAGVSCTRPRRRYSLRVSCLLGSYERDPSHQTTPSSRAGVADPEQAWLGSRARGPGADTVAASDREHPFTANYEVIVRPNHLEPRIHRQRNSRRSIWQWSSFDAVRRNHGQDAWASILTLFDGGRGCNGRSDSSAVSRSVPKAYGSRRTRSTDSRGTFVFSARSRLSPSHETDRV